MIRSMTSCEVADEAKEKVFPATAAAAAPSSSSSPAASSGIAAAGGGSGVRALETSKAEALHERERNSMGSLGSSGGRGISVRHGWPASSMANAIVVGKRDGFEEPVPVYRKKQREKEGGVLPDWG